MISQKEILKQIAEGKLDANQGLKKIEELKDYSQMTYTESKWYNESLIEKQQFQPDVNLKIFSDYNVNQRLEMEILNKYYNKVNIVAKDRFLDELSDSQKRSDDLKEKYDLLYIWCNEEDVYFSFELLKKIAKSKMPVTLLFTSFELDDREKLYFEAMESMLKSIHMEAPFLTLKLLMFADNGEKEVTKKILSEIKNCDRDNILIKYNGLRYVKKNVEISLKNLNKCSGLARGGTYVITGGMGGLGKIFTRFLMSNFDAHIILIGRRLESEVASELKEFEQLNGSCRYYSFNIENIGQLFAEINDRIDGVFHCAGILNDKLLINKSIEDFKKVLFPKVNCSLVLCDIVKQYNIPLLVLFSSITSITGNVGQCDYAYANGFMNCVATNNKENCRMVAISWPLWENGGMTVDDSAKKLMKKKFGFELLDDEHGIESFVEILEHKCSQVSVFKGKKQMLYDIFNIKHEEEFNIDKIDTSISNIKMQTKHYLKKVIEEITKIPSSEINDKDSFDSFGMDSITAMKINDKLEDYFGSLPKSLLYEYMNIEEFVDYFLENHMSQLEKLFGLSNPRSSENSFERTEKKTKERLMARGNAKTEDKHDIAIIGLAGRYPKADNLESFWDNLISGTDCIEEIPCERWDNDKYFSKVKALGKTNSKWGGFIKDVDKFDSLFFCISPREASVMDPQEKLFLETSWSALEDAGYKQSELSKCRVGVFVGAMNSNYQEIPASVDGKYLAHSSILSSVANRVSYHMNFQGPSITVDTMCSSSMTALHLACVSIERGECDVAIAGGVSIIVHPNKYLYLSQGDFLSKDGRCKAFGFGGDGYVPSEGVGAVVLKPLNEAKKDNDQIYGIIKGHAVNHGGKTSGYTVPNPNTQASVIMAALDDANISAEKINYIETHGTGTALGDPIEIAGLQKAYGDMLKIRCPIGSVKSNIGHAEAAAGIASLTKVLLQMKYNKLVPSLHAKKLNNNINFNKIRYYVQQELSEWEGEKYAAISSFGAGGSNSAFIVQNYLDSDYLAEEDRLCFIPLSARNEVRLLESVNLLKAFLEKNIKNESIKLLDIAYTLQTGRECMQSKVVFLCSSKKELLNKLEEFLLHRSGDGIIVSNSDDLNRIEKKIFEGEDGDALVNKIIEGGNVEKLALLWILELSLDYSLIYKGRRRRKISLPTYPFEKVRCWLPQDFTYYDKNESKDMVLYENISDLNGIKYKININKFNNTSSIIDPDCLSQELILETVKSTLMFQKMETESVIRDIEFGNPLKIPNDVSSLIIKINSVNDKIIFEMIDDNNTIIVHGIVFKTEKGIDSFDIKTSNLKTTNLKQEIDSFYKSLGCIKTKEEYLDSIIQISASQNGIHIRFNKNIIIFTKNFWEFFMILCNVHLNAENINISYFIEDIKQINGFFIEKEIKELYIEMKGNPDGGITCQMYVDRGDKFAHIIKDLKLKQCQTINKGDNNGR